MDEDKVYNLKDFYQLIFIKKPTCIQVGSEDNT